MIPFGCTKDGAEPIKTIVISPYTTRFNGTYLGVLTEMQQEPLSTNVRTSQCTYEIKSGYDETHNITTIPNYTYIQFTDNGNYQSSDDSGNETKIIVRNDSLLYSNYFVIGMARTRTYTFKGKKL